jgi:hypothetical protein
MCESKYWIRNKHFNMTAGFSASNPRPTRKRSKRHTAPWRSGFTQVLLRHNCHIFGLAILINCMRFVITSVNRPWNFHGAPSLAVFSSRLISFYLFSSRLILSHLVSYLLVLSCFVSSSFSLIFRRQEQRDRGGARRRRKNLQTGRRGLRRAQRSAAPRGL